MATNGFGHDFPYYACKEIVDQWIKAKAYLKELTIANNTSSSAMAEGPRDALVSRNSATTKYPYRMALFAWSYV